MSEISDADFKRLSDEEALSTRRQEAENQFSSWSTDKIKLLRQRAKNDLFFLTYGVLGYDLLSEKLHGHLARWMERTRRERYRMILLPRGHYKSTQVTIAESIQIALPNVTETEDWPWCLGPDVKILLGHEVRDSASRFLFEIAQAFLEKPIMLALFDECIPSARKQRINKYELELPRKEHHKEPTFDTIGAGGAAQGRHYNHIKLDDIIGEEARESKTVMNRVINWFDNVNSLLTRLKVDGFDLVGTRWSGGDVYEHALKKYGVRKSVSVLNAYDLREIGMMSDGALACYVRGAEEQGVPIFPEEFTTDDLAMLKKNPIVWASQYANNPREAGLTEFQVNWLQYYNWTPDGVIQTQNGRRVHTTSLDINILIDPSMGETDFADEAGFVVTGTDNSMNVYLLEAFKERHVPPDLIDRMLRLYIKWRPRLISIEEVAFSAIYKYWLDEKARTMNLRPSIYKYKPGSRRSKAARIRGLTNFFASGQVYVHSGMSAFLEEYEWFPLGDSQHILDALAQGPEIWTPGRLVQDIKTLDQLDKEVLDERSALTGY